MVYPVDEGLKSFPLGGESDPLIIIIEAVNYSRRRVGDVPGW